MRKANRIRAFRRNRIILFFFCILAINVLDFQSRNIQEPYLYGKALQSAWSENFLYQESFARQIFAILAFLVPSFFIADVFVEDERQGLQVILFTKTSRKHYIWASYWSNFLYSGFFIMLIPLVNVLLWLLIRPAFPLNYVSANMLNSYLGVDLILLHPALYLGAYLLFIFFIGGIIGSLSLMINTMTNNAYMGLAGIFVFDLFIQLGREILSSVFRTKLSFSTLSQLLSMHLRFDRFGTTTYILIMFLLPLIYFQVLSKGTHVLE